jgi:hypothetical protein
VVGPSGEPAAPPEPKGRHLHDGFYFRFALGAGLIGATVTPEDERAEETHAGGFTIPTELAFGGTPAPGVVIGGGFYTLHAPSLKYTQGRGDYVKEEDADFGQVGMLGPFLDVYLDPKYGVHFQAAACYTAVTPGKSDTILTDDVSGEGLGLMAGLGIEGWVGDQTSMGLLARVQYAAFKVEDEDGNEADFQMLAPSLLISVTYH